MTRTICGLAALALAACGTTSTTSDAGGTVEDAAVGDAGTLEADGGPEATDAGGSPRDAGDPAEATVYVHLRATQEPAPHAPSTSGQTPRDWTSGIRSLHLLRDRDDPAPFEVFSHGDGYVEASYADGADTVVGSAPIASLEPGTFLWARVVHTHVRFTIDATAHSTLGAAPGELEDLIVLSDRTTVDGAEHARGDYRYVFRGPGFEIPIEGTGFEVLPIPGGGFHAVAEDGETAYYFPIVLEVDDELTEDVHLVFEVNVHEGFRWTDQPLLGYQPGVFDVAAGVTEPIVQAGANSYTYYLE